jgi:N-carbamoyl-L-amino-acid hydrolase
MNVAFDAQRLDAVGNTFDRWTGSQPELAAVAVSGPGAIEAIRALQNAGCQPRRSVELIQFTSAEPAGFGIGCLGSRLLSGAMPAWKAARLTGADGKTFDEWRAEAGFEGPLESVAVPAGHYAAFVELSAGPDQRPGIATGFAASAGLRVTVEGEGAEDAIGEIAGAVHGLADCVPGRARLEFHVEDTDQAKRDEKVSRIATVCRDTAQRRRIAVKAEVLHMDPAAECGAEVVDALERGAASQSLGYQRMVARGCHDAQFLSRIAPAGMLVIPSPADGANGTLVLAEALAELAG